MSSHCFWCSGMVFFLCVRMNKRERKGGERKGGERKGRKSEEKKDE